MDINQLTVVIILSKRQETTHDIGISVEIECLSLVSCTMVGLHRWEVESVLLPWDTDLTNIQDVAVAEELISEES